MKNETWKKCNIKGRFLAGVLYSNGDFKEFHGTRDTSKFLSPMLMNLFLYKGEEISQYKYDKIFKNTVWIN